ncbi:BTB/POZ domain-containing protein KCTD19 [Rana temporaria]|uniref:BTB/POZ domain-containing protein KCTD19 n=1 Tax=Rana temporaria TaxID=8407 RepID=UPI001AAC73DE|nr:BTB/POZ domain-containing protein KCTD19 [Rana temporaria]
MAAAPPQVEASPADEGKDLFHINAGAWIFSIPKIKLAPFPEFLLYREARLLPKSERSRIFLDRDGFVFRHIHQFLLTSQLPISSLSEPDLLYEQARGLNLPSVIEAIDKLKAGKEEKPHLNEQTLPDIPTSEEAPMNYWKTQNCSKKLSEWPLKMSLSPGIWDRAPLGLLVNPLLDAEEEVHYCFFPVEILEKYPTLVTDDNLLWFSEKFILVECGCPEFRFIGNFLHHGNFFLPDNFSAFDVLEAEINSLEIPALLKALYEEKKSSGSNTDMPETWHSVNSLTAASKSGAKPFYIMSLELLGKYPDSALGQLYVESNVDGSKLYMNGTGTLFQHVKNWFGACRLPLTSNVLEIQGLSIYLEKGDIIYQPMREAIRTYLKQRLNWIPGASGGSWRADLQQYSSTQIVRVYVRSYWYATRLKTLLKYPGLLANSKKTRWITCGFSLLVIGDGSIFRHILNFLRLGRLLLPSDFKEWRLLCQEVHEFNISALKEALSHCLEYRLWVREQESTGCSLGSKAELQDVKCNTAHQQTILVDRSEGKVTENAGCFTSAEGLKRIDSSKRKASSPSQFTTSERNNPGVFPDTKCLKLDRAVDDEEAKITASPISKFMSLVRKLPDGRAKGSMCLLYTSPKLSGRGTVKSQKCVADREMNRHTSGPRPVRKITSSKFSVENGGCKENLVGSAHRSGSSLRAPPVHKDHMHHVLTVSQKDNIKLEATPEDEQCSDTKVSPSLSKYTGQRMEEDRTTIIEHAYCARSLIEGKELSGLGAILWVQHHHLMANDGSAASFQECVVYTAEHDNKQPTNHGAASDDLIFLCVNMSHEELYYARKCHSFLTGIILDSLEQRDPKSTTLCVAGLVSMLWACQIPASQFVEELFTLEMYRDEQRNKETLLSWIELTLPYAKRLSQCITVMLQKRCHKSASCCSLRKVLN